MQRMALLAALFGSPFQWRPMHLVHRVNLVFKDASVICIEMILRGRDPMLLVVVLFADQTWGRD